MGGSSPPMVRVFCRTSMVANAFTAALAAVAAEPDPSVAAAPGGAFGPARMIEVRPGLFVSSYDCVTDDGYGRYRLCSQGLK